MPSPAVAAALDALRAAVAADPAMVAGATQVEDLDALGEAETLLRATQTKWLADAYQRDTLGEHCGRSLRSWLVEEQLLNPAEAARRVTLVHQLPARPATRAAFTDADISADHALVVLAAMRSVPEGYRDAVEAALLDACRLYPPYLVARLVDDILVSLGVERSSDEAAARRYSRRGVDLHETFAGTGSLSGTLTPVLTEKLRALFNQVSDRLGDEDERNSSQRRHDLLEDVVDSYLPDRVDSDSDTDSPDAVNHVVVTVDLDTLTSQLRQRWATLDSGAFISPATARRLACDAKIIPAVLGARGNVLDIGVASRTFNSHVRRAAKLRDGNQCGFPHCRRPVKDCHHIVWWTHGGRSTLHNAVWLCSYHHWLTHEGGWNLRRNPNGSYTWTNRHGRQVTGDPPRTCMRS